MWPHYTLDGSRLVYVQSDGYNLEYIRSTPVGSDDKVGESIAQIDSIGPFDLQADGSLIYEQGRQYRRDYAFEDLFRWDAATGQDAAPHARQARTRSRPCRPMVVASRSR